jgi:hypothetical protein
MKQLGLLAAIGGLCGVLAFASLTASADEGGACVRKDFKTDLVKHACEAGGQAAAKDAMKKWNKEHDITSCNKCHSKLAPSYDLKPDGLDQFHKLGGK